MAGSVDNVDSMDKHNLTKAVKDYLRVKQAFRLDVVTFSVVFSIAVLNTKGLVSRQQVVLDTKRMVVSNKKAV